MPFHQPDSIRYYTFESLGDAGVIHAVFTRRGGVSPTPWNSLNLGGTVGDDGSRVTENRRRAFQALGRDIMSMADVWQVHGNEVVCYDDPRPLNTPHPRADAILTDKPHITLLMRFADCVPILLYDPVRRVAGMAHAGWQGTVKRTAATAVQAMQTRYGSQPENILAAIGPSIGAHHYPVGPEVIAQVRLAFGKDALAFLPGEVGEAPDHAVQFDLWSANRLALEQAGVRRIEISGICTACHPEDWYSHRGDVGKTGRFGAMMALKS